MTKPRFNYRFSLCVAAMFLTPFVILSVHFASRNNELLKKDTLSYLELRTNVMSRMVGETLGSQYDISELVSDKKFLQAGWNGRKALLEKKLKERPDVYMQFALINASGREMARIPGSGKKLKNYSKEAIFTQSMSGKQSLGAVEPGALAPPVLLTAEPIIVPGSQKPSGVLLTRMSLAGLNELVKMGRRSSDEGDGGILDSGGMMIADSRGNCIKSPGMTASEDIVSLVRAAVNRGLDQARGEMRLRGKPVLIAVRMIEGTQWWVYEREPSSIIRGYRSGFWAKRVIFSGLLLILIFSVITERLGVRWLGPEQE